MVALPVYLYSIFDWGFMQVGAFLALWVIAYGLVQAAAPRLLRSRRRHHHGPDGHTARNWAIVLAVIPALIAIALGQGIAPQRALIGGLVLFGVVFAINSAVHSYLIVAWSEHDRVSMNVGFYYMANAGGRLVGTVLSGWVYQSQGLTGCLWWSSAFVLMAAMLSFALPGEQSGRRA